MKVMSQMDISERRIPQDGRIKMKLPNQGHRLPGKHLAHPVGRKNRTADSGPVSAKLGIDMLGYEPEQKAPVWKRWRPQG